MTSESPTPSDDPTFSADPLEQIRSILMRREIEQVEGVLTETQVDLVDLARQVDLLQQELAHLRAEKADSDAVIPAVGESLAAVTSQVVMRQPDDMSDALAPIISMVMRKHVASSKEEMAEAFAPIMLGAIGSAIQDALREFQQQIDGRLSRKRKPQTVVGRVSAEMRGVTSAEVEMRDALPFNIRETFLIQQESGLLLSHFSFNQRETDSDLISAMLTAIRDFVGDAFLEGESSELQEIQYNEERIIIKSGRLAYLALVLDGIEPSGLRMKMQEFVANLHTNHGEALENWDGDSESLLAMTGRLATFSSTLEEREDSFDTLSSRGLPPLAKVALGCLTIGSVAFLCFASWFTFSLLPTALSFWEDEPSPTQVLATATPIATSTPLATPTLLPTSTEPPHPTATPPSTLTPAASVTSTSQAQESQVPTASSTSALPPTPTVAAGTSSTSGMVWLLSQPDVDLGIQIALTEPGTRLIVESQDEIWSLVRLAETDEVGWIMNQWLVSGE